LENKGSHDGFEFLFNFLVSASPFDMAQSIDFPFIGIIINRERSVSHSLTTYVCPNLKSRQVILSPVAGSPTLPASFTEADIKCAPVHYMSYVEFGMVRKDIKLESRPVPSIQVFVWRMLGYLLSRTICALYHHLIVHLVHLLTIATICLLLFCFTEVTSYISDHPVDKGSDTYLEIEAGFSSYSVFADSSDDETEADPIWEYPDNGEGDMEIEEDSTVFPDSDKDLILLPTNFGSEDLEASEGFAFTAYKRVDQKVNPVSGTFPEEAHVHQRILVDPLLSLPKLEATQPPLVDTPRMNKERLEKLGVNSTGFLWPEEEKLFNQVMWLNQNAIAFEENERGTLKESYFTPYIIPTVPHMAWEYRNIPIPPGIRDKVIELLKHKINAGVYKPSQSAYRSRWFCVLKKNGKLCIVHDLQPLNKVTIRDAGLPPIVDDFIEPFAGRQCYTVFDLFWGFDARKVHPQSRDLTAFLMPLGLLRLTSLPMGYTNSPAEFQKCMSFILHNEIPDIANIFIDDLPIKGPESRYLMENGEPEVLKENPGIRRFIWEHAEDVHRIMHRVGCTGGTFASNKAQICQEEVVIVGQKCTPEGRLPEDSKVTKILNWPPLTTPKEARAFLGLCGTVRIWIKNYSELARPLTELWRHNVEFIWDEKRQEAFAKLKELVSSAPALRPIDYTSENPVILSVDSSNIAAGMILSQVDDEDW